MPWLVLFPALAVACYTDVRSRLIRNWLTLPLWAAGLAWQGWSGGWKGFGLSLLGSGVALSAALGGGAGGGDVKLLLAVGAWVGYPMVVIFWGWLAVVRLVDGVGVRLATAHFRWRPFWEGVLAETAAVLGRLPWKPPRSLPGAVLITVAVLLTLMTSWLT